MTDWQPIETVPKDGTRVDLWLGTERLADAYWQEAGCLDDRNEPISEAGWWAPNHGYGGRAGQCFDYTDSATHWRPIKGPHD